MHYTIVKHAKDSYWDHYYDSDPKDGVLPSHSCHTTFTAITAGVKESYTDIAAARVDCETLNTANPSGGYAVCPILFLT